MLALETRREGRLATVTLTGEFSAHDARRFLSVTQSLILDGVTGLVLDLREVDLRDAVGYGVLADVLTAFPSQRGEVALAVTSPEVLARLEDYGLDEAFSLFHDPEGARRWLARRAWI